MSGIISIIHRNETIDQPLLRQMTEFMAFRGPDAQETWCKDNVGIGHALLRTTFEQEREQQPLTLDKRV